MAEVYPVTWWLQRVLSGQIPIEDAPASVQSWSRFHIFEGAREIAKMEYIGDRQAALGKLPPTIRPLVKAELERIWPMRREL